MKIDSKDKTEDRRSFLKQASTLIGVGIALPAIGGMFASCEKHEIPVVVPEKGYSIDLAKYPALQTVGGAEKVKIKGANAGNNVIIRRTSETEFSIVDSICPHVGCEVNLPVGGGTDLVCPCHMVEFSALDGSVTKNPISGSWSSVPLKKFRVIKFENNILEVVV
jgi:nitrite reductase/ring-hydroxylating ferredoxin subunit